MTLEGNILFFLALSRGFYHYIRSHANGKDGIMILGIDVGRRHTDAVLIEGCEEIFTDTTACNGTFT